MDRCDELAKESTKNQQKLHLQEKFGLWLRIRGATRFQSENAPSFPVVLLDGARAPQTSTTPTPKPQHQTSPSSPSFPLSSLCRSFQYCFRCASPRCLQFVSACHLALVRRARITTTSSPSHIHQQPVQSRTLGARHLKMRRWKKSLACFHSHKRPRDLPARTRSQPSLSSSNANSRRHPKLARWDRL